MRYAIGLLAVLVYAGASDASERQRFRVVNKCPQTFTVVHTSSTVVNGSCTYCTDCKCAAGQCPGKCPVAQPVAEVVPATFAAPVVSSCPGGNCAAPVQSRGLFGFRRW